jgi:hypothetical protein
VRPTPSTSSEEAYSSTSEAEASDEAIEETRGRPVDARALEKALRETTEEPVGVDTSSDGATTAETEATRTTPNDSRPTTNKTSPGDLQLVEKDISHPLNINSGSAISELAAESLGHQPITLFV